MKKLTFILSVVLITVILASCSGKERILRHTFDSSENIASHEFQLEELGKDFPANWEGYKFLVMEIRSSTAQRFLLGINTDNGLHEKRTHVFPQAWLRLSIPLEYFREKPQPANDLAATVNKPLTVGFMHIEGGTVGPLTGIKGLSFRYYTPLNNPTIEIRSIELVNENPGCAYLDTIPFIDEFGQWNRGDFEGKAKSLDELKSYWEDEENNLKPLSKELSKYGGYLAERIKGTGYFRVEKIDNRWWFIDPEGCLFLSIGSNGIERPGGGGSASEAPGLENVCKAFPPQMQAGPIPGQGQRPGAPRYISYGEWNLQRRYGEQWREKAADMTLRRMDAWGFNTGSVKPDTKPFLSYARGYNVPSIFGLQDIFIPDYEKRIEEGVKNSVSSQKNNPYLIGYFLQNEPSWLEQEPRVCELILNGDDVPLKANLQKYLAEGDSPERRTEFVHNTFRKHIETVTKYLRQYDPNHLSLGIRFGHSSVPHDNILKICKDFFDVYSFNTYRLSPNMEYVNEIARKIDMPMILGEFHFGTIDRGMAPGLVQVADQQERAIAFRYFAENTFANPSIIGISWFQYTDQGLIGRGDGERYNIGIIDVTDRPYPIVQGVIEAASNAYEVHKGIKEPFSRIPNGVRGNEDDLKSVSNQ